MNAQKGKLGKSAIIWLAAIISTIVCVAALLIWLLSSFNIVGGRLYDKDEYFVIDGTAYSNAEYFELDGKAYDFATYFEIDGVAYDYESSFEFEGASYPRSEYFTAGDRLYDYATYFCLNDTAYAHADYFLLSDTAYDRAEWFEHDGAAYRHSEHYVAHDRLYEIKEITLGGKTFMSDVTELELRDCGITDISVLADCGKLEKLDLGSDWNGTGNTNRIEDISALSELYGLKYLDLSANKISDASPISGLINLEHLNLELNRLASLEALTGMTELIYLDVSDNFWINEEFRPLYDYFSDYSHLETLKKLVHLDVSGNGITVGHGSVSAFESIGKLKQLEWLDLSNLYYNSSGQIDITPLSELLHLEVLKMRENADVVSCSPMAGLTKLTCLDLYNTWICDGDISFLSDLTGLTKLNIVNAYENNLYVLENLIKLEYLAVNSGDGDISFLAGLKELRKLMVYDNHKGLQYSLEGLIDDYSPIYDLSNLEEVIIISFHSDATRALVNARPDVSVTVSVGELSLYDKMRSWFEE